jgi:hypothetical protein
MRRVASQCSLYCFKAGVRAFFSSHYEHHLCVEGLCFLLSWGASPPRPPTPAAGFFGYKLPFGWSVQTAGTPYPELPEHIGRSELPKHQPELPEHHPELPEHIVRNCRNKSDARNCRNTIRNCPNTIRNCRNTSSGTAGTHRTLGTAGTPSGTARTPSGTAGTHRPGLPEHIGRSELPEHRAHGVGGVAPVSMPVYDCVVEHDTSQRCYRSRRSSDMCLSSNRTRPTVLNSPMSLPPADRLPVCACLCRCPCPCRCSYKG